MIEKYLPPNFEKLYDKNEYKEIHNRSVSEHGEKVCQSRKMVDKRPSIPYTLLTYKKAMTEFYKDLAEIH